MVVQASDSDAAWVRCSEHVPPGGHPGADPVEHAGEREVWVPGVINLRFCSDIQIVRNLV